MAKKKSNTGKFVLGAAVGAALGLLFAPKSGKETRRAIKEKASDLLSKTEQTIKTICEFPYSFADCSYFLISDEHIRHAVIDNYILVYEIVESVKEIRVLRFRYAKMDLTKLKSKN